MEASDANNLVSNNGTLIFEVNGQKFEFIADVDNEESFYLESANNSEDQEYTIIVSQTDDSPEIDESQNIIINDLSFEPAKEGENTLEENAFTFKFPTMTKDEHTCLVCGRMFSRKHDTKRHIKTVHLKEKHLIQVFYKIYM